MSIHTSFASQQLQQDRPPAHQQPRNAFFGGWSEVLQQQQNGGHIHSGKASMGHFAGEVSKSRVLYNTAPPMSYTYDEKENISLSGVVRGGAERHTNFVGAGKQQQFHNDSKMRSSNLTTQQSTSPNNVSQQLPLSNSSSLSRIEVHHDHDASFSSKQHRDTFAAHHDDHGEDAMNTSTNNPHTKSWISVKQAPGALVQQEDDQMSTTSSCMDDDDSDYVDDFVDEDDEYLLDEEEADEDDDASHTTTSDEDQLIPSHHQEHSFNHTHETQHNSQSPTQVSDDSGAASQLQQHPQDSNLVWPLVHSPCQDCSEYTSHIIALMRHKEHQKRPSPTYLDGLQTDINQQMRSILVDWLVDVSQEFQLENTTIHLAVNYTDRFLSLNRVTRDRLQLCGVTALLIASKYNEKQPPCVDDFVYITDHTYTRDQVLFMESTMLNSLDFAMTVVTQLDFMEHFLRVSHAPSRDSPQFKPVFSLVQYLSELSLHEYDLLKYTSSALISACIIVALHTLNIPSWSQRMEHYLQYTAQELSEAVNEVYQIYCYQCYQQNSLHALRDKYTSESFQKVALQAPRADNPLIELKKLTRVMNCNGKTL
mmetsp:Transcript_8990/g.33159  ORF Transcript_8990/g.33159 Transcript_8990/m.33159 type:complete len:593 (-) Transcript_8990:304-2082(-)|eukprot:CAMPEP_0117444796 /NCGR_PEP_ID=MMETSP0759-20121206/5442_1 /TAXON_ID=63605 /ORGANISM="Percolomonas cosmopolitus, Strain WS" /LENGTH=592 /DNA_ID=CAMNT_0005236907 /DNA_START=815 /DNA_END=2593 /DNA_ORIENTATION=+